MSDLPSMHAVATIALVAASLYLFASDRFRAPSVGLAILLTLTLGSYVFPYPGLEPTDFFARFGHEALVTVCTLLLLVKGLETTGALQPLTTGLARSWQHIPRLALPLTLVLTAFSSAFINDTPLMTILLPVILAVSLRAGAAPSRVLLPFNYAVLIGGMATTVGSSTNLLGLGVAEDLGLEPLALFDLAPPVLFAGGLGLLFVWIAARFLLPESRPASDEEAQRRFSAVLYVNEGSYAQGRALAEVLVRTQNRMHVERIQRGDDLTVASLPDTVLVAGDRLFVSDSAGNLKEYESLLGATLYNASDLQHPVSERFPLDAAGQRLAEVVITRGSPLYQRPLDMADFVYRYQLLPLAVHRGSSIGLGAHEAHAERLRAGDVILVQGTAEAIGHLKGTGSMLVLDGAVDLPRTDRAPLALAIAIAVMTANALGLVPISVSALLGVAAMLATRCLQWRHISQVLSASLLMVMVSTLCLATALDKTGAAEFVARAFVAIMPQMPLYAVLGVVMLGVTVLTNFVTNNAAAVICVPTGIYIARQLGAPEEAFVMAIIFGANMAFATPFGYQTNLMIMKAGGYTGADYLRIGIPLTAIMLVALTFALSVLYGLQ